LNTAAPEPYSVVETFTGEIPMRRLVCVSALILTALVTSQAAASTEETPAPVFQIRGISLDGIFFQEGTVVHQRTRRVIEEPQEPEPGEGAPEHAPGDGREQPRPGFYERLMAPALSIFSGWHTAPNADQFYAKENRSGVIRVRDIEGSIFLDFEVQLSLPIRERFGADVGIAVLNGPDRGLNGTLTSVDLRFDIPTRSRKVFPYVKGGVLFGSIDWDEDGSFRSATGYEVGVGFLVGSAHFCFTFEFLHRSISFDYRIGPYTIEHKESLDFNGVTFKFGLTVFLF
jgi:hypothetical protein